MRVLVAFDKFKDALTAPAACALAHATLRTVRPDWTVTLCPLADGGEGFASILTAAAGGTWHACPATGPRGRVAPAGFGLIDPTRLAVAARNRLDLGPVRCLAVIEMATASGLQALPPAERDPWHTDTRGTGELMRAALAAGADAVLLGVGGSATHDLGLGALTALGWQALDRAGHPIAAPTPATWPDLERLVPTAAGWPPIRIACDVTNPLLGPRGAAAVFAPQKGLRPGDKSRLETATARVAKLIGSAAGRPGRESTPGAGAAGGMAFGLLAATGAQLVPGFDLVEEWLDLAAQVAAADLIITGEGRFDASSLEGKGPGALAARAATAGKPVWIFAGAVADDLPGRPVGMELHPITPPATPLATALATAGANLQRTLAARLA